MPHMMQNQYEQYIAKKTKITKLLEDADQVISTLSMEQFQQNLQQLRAKVESDIFRVLVLGTFKNGKSTFINALLGEDVLPAYAIPCTAVINEVKYAEEKRAVVSFRNPLPEVLPTELSPRALEHMKKYNMKDVPPLEIPWDELEEVTVIPMGMEARDMLLESPYQKVELYWPLEILKNGVEIIDSPGLNENAERTKVTMEYLSQADAIIMLMAADKACAQTEMEFVENILKVNGYDDIFFPVNRFDIIDPKQQPMLRRFVENKVLPYTALEKNGIFYLSSLNALNGKMNGNDAQYMESGMPEFEKALSLYLTNNKGKAKLVQPAKELKRVLSENALYKVIPMQRKALSTSLDEQKKRYNQAKPQFDQLKQRKDILAQKMEARIERSLRDFRSSTSRFQQDLAGKVATWIDEYKLKTSLGVIPKKERIAAACEELQQHVMNMAQKTQAQWRNEVLMPMAEEKMQDIFESAEGDVAQIISGIDCIVEQKVQSAPLSGAPLWQRIAGAAGGLLMGDVGMAVSGGLHGFSKEMVKTLAIEVGAGFVLGLFGLLNPVTLIAVIAGAVLMNLHDSASKNERMIKEKVKEAIYKAMVDGREQVIDSVVAQMGDAFGKVARGITVGLEKEISEAEHQLQYIVRELEKGEANVRSKAMTLDRMEQQIQQLNSELDDVIFSMM